MSLLAAASVLFVKRYIIQNDCTLDTCPIELAEVLYDPSLGGNVLYLTIFAILVPVQAYFGIHHRTWGFFGVMTAGLILEIIGYVARVQLHFNPFHSGPFVMYVSSRSFFIPAETFEVRTLTQPPPNQVSHLSHNRAHLLRCRHLPLLLSADRRVRGKPIILPAENLCRRVYRLRRCRPHTTSRRWRHRSTKRRPALTGAERDPYHGRRVSAASRLVSLFRLLLHRLLPARSCAPRRIECIIFHPADVAKIWSIPLL
jgi:hypothetical protein